ncbi:MAG: hypothetical protein JOY54_16405 [Acidobacteriaceae bacterium]|nr:hypothetical protein [Acidobacteriaceae bacterium]
MFRRISSVSLALFAALAVVLAHPKKADDPVFKQINGIVATLSEITGLSQEHPVAYGRMTKAQLRHFLSKRIKKTIKPDEIHADELALKMFGLVPQDFDLKKSTVDLLTEQAAAFYDYDAKKLFLLEGTPFEDETTTLAHELAHALVDQHFDLEHFMDESPTNDDENLAHTAVVEGQASWLMIAYDLKQEGQPPVPSQDMLKSVEDSSEDSMTDFPVLKASPLYIQQSLLFPYTEGTAFFDAVYKKMGKSSFSAVFKDAPVDTSQIMHPERYFAHQAPARPELVKLGEAYSDEVTEGSVGEFDHQMLLRRYLGEAEAKRLAAHLAGGQFKIFTNGRKKKPLLNYASEWDSNALAAVYFAAYKRVLHNKWAHCDVSTQTDSVFAGVGDNGYFVTILSGNTVSSVEGLADAAEWERLKGGHSTQSTMEKIPAATISQHDRTNGAALR